MFGTKQLPANRGGITLLLLALLIMVILVLNASLRLIAQQTHQTVDQQHKLQTLDVADAGVQYTTWLVAGSNRPVDALFNLQSADLTRTLVDSDNRAIGSFNVTFPTMCSDRFQVISIGHDSNQPSLCQTVEAVLQKDSINQYRITSWEQHIGSTCSDSSVNSPLVCPTPVPTPTITPLPT